MRQCRRFSARAAAARDPALIRYRVRLADLDRHWFEIECRIEDPAEEQRFSLPAWIPGSYLLRDFARHVVASRSEERSRAVGGEKTAAATWGVRGAGRTLIVHDHRLRARPIGARRLSRSSARVLQRPVRVRAAGGARRRADRSNARAAAASAVRGLARRNGARTRRDRRTRLRRLPGARLRRAARSSRRDRRASRASSSRPAACRITWSSRAVSSRTSSASPWTCSSSARRRSSSSARPRRSIGIGFSAWPSATATAGSSIARRRASSSAATICRRSARRANRATTSGFSRS